MKKFVARLLALVLICTMGIAAASAETAAVTTSRGATLTMDVSVSGGGKGAKIGIKTNGAPVTFAKAVGGSVNDTVPPREFADFFVVTNLDGIDISADGTSIGQGAFTVADLAAGVVGRLSFTVNADAPYGTYTVEAYLAQGSTTVTGSVTFTVVAPVPGERIPGDANNDGSVNALDAMTIAKYAAGWDNVAINLSNADVNADGAVNALDAMTIAKYAAGWDGVVLQ